MAVKFKKPAAGVSRAKVLLIGDAGVGKTHACLTFPNPVVIDTEGGTGFFAGRSDHGLQPFEVAQTRSYDEIMGLIKDVRAGRVPCDTLVIDGITSIWNVIQRSFPDDRYFKIIKPKFRDFVDFLYEKVDKHVVMTAWEKELYAAPGTVVNGKIIEAKDMVSIGKTLDADKKAMFGFDFVVRIFEERGKRYGEVLKSRSHKLPKGTRIATSFDDVPAWKIFEPLLSSVEFEEQQTEAEAVEHDAEGDAAKRKAMYAQAKRLDCDPATVKELLKTKYAVTSLAQLPAERLDAFAADLTKLPKKGAQPGTPPADGNGKFGAPAHLS